VFSAACIGTAGIMPKTMTKVSILATNFFKVIFIFNTPYV
jgi:hypothetical protein